MKTLSLLALFTVAAASLHAQATKPSAPLTKADSAIAGEYDLEVATDQGAMTGALSLKAGPTGFTGNIGAGGHSNKILSVVRADKTYAISAGNDGVAVVFRITFRGDSLHGTFKLEEGMSGSVLGARKR